VEEKEEEVSKEVTEKEEETKGTMGKEVEEKEVAKE